MTQVYVFIGKMVVSYIAISAVIELADKTISVSKTAWSMWKNRKGGETSTLN